MEPDNNYDSIVSTLSYIAHYSSSKLYSLEYYKIAKRKLTPSGVFAIWYDSRYPLYDIDIFYNTLLKVFNECKTFLLDPWYHLMVCGDHLKYQNHREAPNEFIRELLSYTPQLEIGVQTLFGVQKYDKKINMLNKLITSYKKNDHPSGSIFKKLVKQKIRDVSQDQLEFCKAVLFFGTFWECHCLLYPEDCCPQGEVYCINQYYDGECRSDCSLKYEPSSFN